MKRPEGWGRAISQEWLSQANNVLHWVPVAMGLGILFYFSLPVEPSVWVGILPLMVCTYALWHVRNKYDWLYFFCFFVLLFCAGYLIAQFRTYMVAAPVLTKETGIVRVTGRIVDIDLLPSGYRVVVSDPLIEGIAAKATPKKIRVTVRTKAEREPAPGDHVTFLAKLNPPSAPVAPNGFDFRRYAYFKQLGGFGYALSPVEIISSGVDHKEIWLEDIRQQIGRKIIQALHNNQIALIATALLTGEKNGIAHEDIEAMRLSGLAHLLAISGLHVGLVAGFLFFSFRAVLAANETLALNWPVKKIAACLVIPCVWGYTVLVGAPVPTQRAFFMTGLALLAIVLDRPPISMRLVALAACVVLFMSPESLLGASFQLSFAAVIALVAFYQGSTRLLRRWHYHAGLVKRGAIYIFGVAVTSLVASIATAPFVLFHFQRMAIFGVFANLVAVPVMAFLVMPSGLVALFLMPFGWEDTALQVMAWGIDVVLSIAHYVASIKHSVLYTTAWPGSAIFFIALGLVFIALWQGRCRWCGLVPVLIGGFMAILAPQPDIMISDDLKQIAFLADRHDLLIADKRHAKFIGKRWAELAGDPDPAYFPKEGRDKREVLTCGFLGCRAYKNGYQISFVFDPRALDEDCHLSDVIISKVPVHGQCDAKLVIDRFDVWLRGAHAIYLYKDRPLVRNVRDSTGVRPWSMNHPDIKP